MPGHVVRGSPSSEEADERPKREPQLPSQRAAAKGGAMTGMLGKAADLASKVVPGTYGGNSSAWPVDSAIAMEADRLSSADLKAAGFTYLQINTSYPGAPRSNRERRTLTLSRMIILFLSPRFILFTPTLSPHTQHCHTGLKCISEQPPIFTVEDFLTEQECAALIQTAGPLLQRSKTHASAGSEATKGRTSLTCHLAKKIYPCPIMLQKIQGLTNKPYGHMELPQVARYASSQRYVEHYDGVDPHTEAGRVFCASGGQRVATVLMYLNDVADGGATRFKRLEIEVKPKKGMALIFFPGFMNGELDTDALHAGMPAVDTKWVSQVWLRQSFREDGQPSSPVPIEEQSLVGPLHEGLYKGLSIAGSDVHEEVLRRDGHESPHRTLRSTAHPSHFSIHPSFSRLCASPRYR